MIVPLPVWQPPLYRPQSAYSGPFQSVEAVFVGVSFLQPFNEEPGPVPLFYNYGRRLDAFTFLSTSIEDDASCEMSSMKTDESTLSIKLPMPHLPARHSLSQLQQEVLKIFEMEKQSLSLQEVRHRLSRSRRRQRLSKQLVNTCLYDLQRHGFLQCHYDYQGTRLWVLK